MAARFGTFNEAARVGSALEDTLYPEFLQKILNDDHIVQIGKWLIKVEKEKEQVLVLDKKYLDQYNDLVTSNVSNKNILVYSTEEEVLDMLPAGQQSKVALFGIKLTCKDNYADYKSDPFDHAYDNTGRFRLCGQVRYEKFGLASTLFIEAKTQYRTDIGIWDERNIGAPVGVYFDSYYVQRCAGTETLWGQVYTGGSSVRREIISGGRYLKQFRLAGYAFCGPLTTGSKLIESYK